MPSRPLADTQYTVPTCLPISGQQSGVVLSHSTLYDAPSSHAAQAPLHFTLVRMGDGNQLLTQLTDVAGETPVAIGDEVEMVTRILTTEGSRGVIVYGYKFRPILREPIHES